VNYILLIDKFYLLMKNFQICYYKKLNKQNHLNIKLKNFIKYTVKNRKNRNQNHRRKLNQEKL